MDKHVISIEHVEKTFRTGFFYKKVQAVKDLSFSVEEGEIFGFLGPNGAGKTTTIKMLMGLIHPTAGNLKIFGKPFDDISAKSELGYAPEQPTFYDYLTGYEFLNYYGKLCGVSSDDSKKRIPRLFEMVGLKNVEKLSLRKFSKGMLQRIGIAQAMVSDPKLLVLDEPMSGLDPIGRREIRDLILTLKKNGKTIFFSTHILPDVEMICDRVGIIVKGTLRKLGRIDEFLDVDTSETELCIRGLPENVINDLGVMATSFIKRGMLCYFSLPDHEMALKILNASTVHGGQLVSLMPKRKSLEDVFMTEMQK